MKQNRQRNLQNLNSDRLKKINKTIGRFNHHTTRLYESLCDSDQKNVSFNCNKLIELANEEKDKLTK